MSNQPVDEYAFSSNTYLQGKLRKQNRQDYIQNNPMFGNHKSKQIEDNAYDDYYNVRLGPNDNAADIKMIDEIGLNAFLLLKNSNNSSPEHIKISSKAHPEHDRSEDKINYDRAFEEMKFEIERNNYIQSKYNIAEASSSQGNLDEIYDNFLDNDINSPFLENDQRSDHSNDSDNNELLLRDVDASDVANEVDEEYNKNGGISIPASSRTACREEHDLVRNEAGTSYRQLINPGSSTNTITKAITNVRSIESSESITRSPV